MTAPLPLPLADILLPEDEFEVEMNIVAEYGTMFPDLLSDRLDALIAHAPKVVL